MKSLFVAFLTALQAFQAAAAPASPSKAPFISQDNATLISNHYVVLLNQNHTLDKHFANIGKNLTESADLFKHMGGINAYHAVLDNHTVHELVRNDPGVDSVEQNYVVHGVQKGIEDTQSENTTSTLSKRWGLGPIFRITDSTYGAGMTSAGEKLPLPLFGDQVHDVYSEAGTNVHIYVMDTGIRLSHVAFHGRAVNFKDLTDSPYVPEVMDDLNGHGTHVAAIAGGIRDGTAINATLVNVKILNKSNDGNYADIVNALTAVTDEHVAYRSQGLATWRGSVINLSVRLAQGPSLALAFRRAKDEGIPVAVAAGNDNLEADHGACIYTGDTICVAASDIDYFRWNEAGKGKGSNYGPNIGIIAPGSGIVSAYNTDDTTYRRLSGTSQATPFVAGALAIFVGYEKLYKNRADADAAFDRLSKNTIDNIIGGFKYKAQTPNRFVNTGINNPKRESNTPYYGAPGRELKKEKRGGAAAKAMTGKGGDQEQAPPPAANKVSEPAKAAITRAPPPLARRQYDQPDFVTLGIASDNTAALPTITESYSGAFVTAAPSADDDDDPDDTIDPAGDDVAACNAPGQTNCFTPPADPMATPALPNLGPPAPNPPPPQGPGFKVPAPALVPPSG